MAVLSEYVIFRNGKKRPDGAGKIPVYGGNGILDYTNESNLQSGIIIGRVGAYCGSVFLEKNNCWVSDNAISAESNAKSDIIFLYYLLKHLRLNERRVGTSQPLLTQGILNNIEVDIPDVITQQKIGAFLESLDKKIAINQKINNNLAA